MSEQFRPGGLGPGRGQGGSLGQGVVENDAKALEHASDELKVDKEVVMAAENQEKLAKKKD